MRREKRVLRWLAVLLGVILAFGVAPGVALAADANNGGDHAVYVSSEGVDTNDGTTPEKAVQTLAHAVEIAPDGATIYVMSNLEMTECARFYGKHLTITSATGGPYTVTRAASFATIRDDARQWYNPAMIEVDSTSGPNTASLTITNLTLDDGGNKQGEYFIQASSRGTGATDFGDLTVANGNAISNTDIVQDAIIATYNNVGTITLGDGAVLKNFGGMSAVRLASGTLVMESGSKIVDDTVTDRTRGTEISGADRNYYGPAGAVWLQGGSIDIRHGAEISGIIGRAIYADGGSITVNGSINNIVGDSEMWWGNNNLDRKNTTDANGYIMHLRSGATATLGSTGVIDGQDRKTSGSSVAVLGGCEFSADEGSIIKNVAGGNIIDVGGTAYLNGEIAGCSGGGHIILAQSSSDHYVRIGETANIHNNKCAYGVIYTQLNNGIIDIYGKLNNNVSTDRAGVVAIANNGSCHPTVNMYDGAEMLNNVSYQSGGAVMVSVGTFNMYGGTISENISGANCTNSADKVGGGVHVRRGGQFIMYGGTISNNSAAGIGGNIALQASDYNGSVPYVQLNGGTVRGGTMNATVTQTDSSYSASEGVSNDLAIVGGAEFGKTDRYLAVSNDVVLSEKNIYMDDYGFYLENPANGVKLGNASSDAEEAAKTKYTSLNLTKVVGSFWYETGATQQTFSVSGLTHYESAKPLYAAVVATNSEGKPISNAVSLVTVGLVDADASFDLDVPGANSTGYAVVFLQEGDAPVPSFVTVTPVDLTVYEGGGGYEAVVDENGEVASSNSMPHPLFHIEGVSNPAELTFENKTTGKSWTVVQSGDYYYFMPVAEDQDNVRVSYTDLEGTTYTNDTFDVNTVQDTFAQYFVNLYLGENNIADLSAKQDDDVYAVALGSGTLTVRAVEASDPSNVTTNIAATVPSGKLGAGTAVAVVPDGGTTYTLNDTGVELPNDAKPQLLFDDIIKSDGVDRESALKDRVDNQLGGANSTRQYQMKYLDLVDGANSNAWIKSKNGVDIYWAYPEGTDQSTDFKLLHLKDLHRDGTQSGFNVADVDNAEIEDVTIEKTAQGIRFHVVEGGFSPYVLTWNASSGGGTTNPGGGTTNPGGGTEEPEVRAIPMYRLYNPWTGEHLYTANVVERDYLDGIGWNYEGVAWYAPETSSTPVWRLYNPFSGDHHYTTDKNEYDELAKIGWLQEGIGWYSDDAKGVALWRLFNPFEQVGTHLYTADKNEYDCLPTLGWRQEGVAWYGLKLSTDGTVE